MNGVPARRVEHAEVLGEATPVRLIETRSGRGAPGVGKAIAALPALWGEAFLGRLRSTFRALPFRPAALPWLVVALMLPAVAGHAQPGAADAPAGLAPLSDVPMLKVAAIDAGARAAEAGPGAPGKPFRFADPVAVDVTPATHGRWEVTDAGRTAVWRLRVVAPGAVSLNFGFTRYRMPPGGRLRLSAPDGAGSAGPFTSADNESHGELWTPLVPANEVVIEVALPANRKGDLELELGRVNRGFRQLPAAETGLRHHGSCHVNVACSAADPYRDQVRSVALVSIAGAAYCSGVLVNNTAGDGTPYLLTARHCLASHDLNTVARRVVVYWNYESETCTGITGASRAESQSGAYLRAHHTDTDMALLELDDPLDTGFDLYLAGWSRDATAVPTSVVNIHHPHAHVKSISLDDDAPTITDVAGLPSSDGDYLLVEDWDRGGKTEGGSSGSPLFDQNKRVVGNGSRGGGV